MDIKRFAVTANATLGMLTMEGVPPLWTLEQLWRDNQDDVSCIPTGTYTCVPHGWNDEAVRFTKVWEVTQVPGREAILLHAGNFDTDTHGCILVGMSISKGVLQNSRQAINLLRTAIGAQSFTLMLTDAITLPATAQG